MPAVIGAIETAGLVASGRVVGVDYTSPENAGLLVAIVGIGRSILGGVTPASRVRWSAPGQVFEFTRLSGLQNVNDCRVEIWVYPGPPLANSAPVVVEIPQSAALCTAVYALSDADGRFTNRNTDQGNSADTSVSLNSTSTDLVIDGLCAATSNNAFGPYNRLFAAGSTGENTIRIWGQSTPGSLGTVNMTWTINNPAPWAQAAISFEDVQIEAKRPLLPVLGAG